MKRLKAFLADFDYRLQQDLSKRWEINLFAFLGYMLISLRMTELWGINYGWALVIPGILFALFVVNQFFLEKKPKQQHPHLEKAELSLSSRTDSVSPQDAGILSDLSCIGCLVLAAPGALFMTFMWLSVGVAFLWIILDVALGGQTFIKESGSQNIVFFTSVIFFIGVFRPLFLWLDDAYKNKIIMAIILIFLGWQYSWEAWIVPSRACESYKKERNWTEKNLIFCKKNYAKVRSILETQSIARTCEGYGKKFKLDRGLVERCQKSSDFRNALAAFKNSIDKEHLELLSTPGYFRRQKASPVVPDNKGP